MQNRTTAGAVVRCSAVLYMLLMLLISATLSAASKLETNSPFLPPGYSNKKPEAPKPVRQSNSPLSQEVEFRGIVQLNDVYEFSLFHKTENRGYWIPENGTENGISVRDFDLDTMRITVTVNGRSEQLSLMAATDNPLPVTTSTAVSIPGSPSAQIPTTPELANTANKAASPRRRIPRRRVILPKK